MKDKVEEKAKDALIAYVTWDRVVPWKILSLPDKKDGFFFPVGYGSNQPALKHAKRDTTLWVVTLPWVKIKSCGIRTYPFVSLVARLQIAGVYKCCCKVPRELRSRGVSTLLEIWGWVAVAKSRENSRFYELNNVNKALQTLEVVESSDLKNEILIRKKIGARLQSIRVLKGRASAVEQRFAEDLASGHPESRQVFLSFKSNDNDSYVYALGLAKALLDRGYSSWLDSLSIPLYYKLASDDRKGRARLRRLIELGLRQCHLAIGLVSKQYATGNKGVQGMGYWTEFERQAIKNETVVGRPEFRSFGILDKVSKDDPRNEAFQGIAVKRPDTRRMAKAIVDWYEDQLRKSKGQHEI